MAYPSNLPDASPAPSNLAGAISVASLNMARERNVSKILDGINRAPRIRDADVLLLQEVANDPGRQSVAEQLARDLGYHVFFAPAGPTICDQGLAVLSRYPIADISVIPLKRYDLRFHSRHRFSIAARIQTPAGDVKIWDVHLDTRLNAAQRLEQLRPVLNDAARFLGPRLVGGDFNTNEFAWIGNVMPAVAGPSHAQIIRREMQRCGFETPFADALITFPRFRRHLDWIYASGLKNIDCTAEPMPFSDHNAISARFELLSAMRSALPKHT